jgi:hypothetical protein
MRAALPLEYTRIAHGPEVAVELPHGLRDRTLGRPRRARQTPALPAPLQPGLSHTGCREIDTDAKPVTRLVRAGAVECRADDSSHVELGGDIRQPDRRLRVVDQDLTDNGAHMHFARRARGGPALM